MDLLEEYINNILSRRPIRREDCTLMQSILQMYQCPQLRYPTIHVAGTNGKGSVSAKIAYALQKAGYKVGLFISPHLFHYEERITINQIPIPRKKIVEYDKDLQQIAKTPLNFFECTTCFGFRYFAEEKVDVAVIEAGIGGFRDSTNVIQPLLAIITSVSLDHMGVLGNTLEKIAEEKSGIIKPNTSVVVGSQAQFSPIFERAKKLEVPLYVVEKQFPDYELDNQETAKLALSVLSQHFTLTQEDIASGLAYRLPCRFEEKKNVIFDVAHNPDGFARLAQSLKLHYPQQKFRFVIGISKTKDIKSSLQEIAPYAAFVHFVKAPFKGTSLEILAKEFTQISSVPFALEKEIIEGVSRAMLLANQKEKVVICGSFYIMAEAKRAFEMCRAFNT